MGITVEEEMVSLLGLAKRFLRTLALCHVAGHFAKAAESPRFVAQRRDDHIGPKGGTILAHPPAFILESPLRCCYFQFVLGFATLHVLASVELGEVPAEYLFCAIAFDPFCPGIPAHHVTVRI